jgi:hypothetical protein
MQAKRHKHAKTYPTDYTIVFRATLSQKKYQIHVYHMFFVVMLIWSRKYGARAGYMNSEFVRFEFESYASLGLSNGLENVL